MDIKERICDLVKDAAEGNCTGIRNRDECKRYEFTCINCITDSILALFEPVTLEALTDEEINEIGIKVYPMTGIAGRQVDLANKVSQATIAKYGQLYRIKEG